MINQKILFLVSIIFILVMRYVILPTHLISSFTNFMAYSMVGMIMIAIGFDVNRSNQHEEGMYFISVFLMIYGIVLLSSEVYGFIHDIINLK